MRAGPSAVSMDVALAGVHVLLVDDRVGELHALMGQLESMGMRVSVARDGLQGYYRALAVAPDAILMDVRMPGLDGFGACRLIKTDPATAAIPVLFLSAAGSDDMRVRGLQEGGSDYIVKPCVPLEVALRLSIHVMLANAMRHTLARPAERRSRPRLPPTQGRADGSAQVHAAMRFICRHLTDPLTLQGIAQMVGVTEKRLARLFQKHLGLSVMAALRMERMEVAKRLLRDSPMSVTHVAAKVGYTNPANFATAFREQVGVAPSAYRLQVRRQKGS